MPKSLGYISTGDRVVISGPGQSGNPFGGQDLSKFQGMHGLVVSEDGWGKCRVQLDDNAGTMTAWNGADLKYEEDDEKIL